MERRFRLRELAKSLHVGKRRDPTLSFFAKPETTNPNPLKTKPKYPRHLSNSPDAIYQCETKYKFANKNNDEEPAI